jgi:hypothetical protein
MSKSQAPAPQGASQNTAVPSPPAAASPATASTASAGPAVQTTDPSDVAALLKEVLMKISNEVPSTPPLTGKAADAVLQFQDISQDLRTLADRRGAGGSLKAPPAPRAAVR